MITCEKRIVEKYVECAGKDQMQVGQKCILFKSDQHNYKILENS